MSACSARSRSPGSIRKGAQNSLFTGGRAPDAILAITLHSLELISPAAQSWGKPVVLYSALPTHGQSHQQFAVVLNRRTQEAARDVMTNPQWAGKTLMMAWEHDHIANHKLEKEFPGEKVTLRQLLNLDMKSVPETWPGDNYDYFWIVDYAKGRPPDGLPVAQADVRGAVRHGAVERLGHAADLSRQQQVREVSQ